MISKYQFVVACLLVACMVGCNPADQFAIDGTVTFDGQPMSEGSVTFIPTQGGPTYGGLIENGTFSVNNGPLLKAGEYRVQIESWKITTTIVQELDNEGPVNDRVQVVPARYNLDSQLTIDVASNATHFPFDLLSEQTPPRD